MSEFIINGKLRSNLAYGSVSHNCQHLTVTMVVDEHIIGKMSDEEYKDFKEAANKECKYAAASRMEKMYYRGLRRDLLNEEQK